MSAAITSPEALVSQFLWRAAVKKFDPSRKIPAATWQALEQSLLLAPSSFGLQPWKFFIVDSAVTRAALRPHAFNQPQVTDASHLVVIARRTTTTPAHVERYMDRIAEVRSVPKASLEGFKSSILGTITGKEASELSNQNARQAFIPLGCFLTACAVLGVDSCPMGGFDPDKFDEVLGLKAQGFASTVLVAAGYRAADDPYSSQAKVRFPHPEVIQHV